MTVTDSQHPADAPLEYAGIAELLQLCAGTEQDRARDAAVVLLRRGVAERGSTLPRGSVSHVAPARVTASDDQLGLMARWLTGGDALTRSQVALALGEWGGEQAAEDLAAALPRQPDDEGTLHCISALQTLGGAVALRALRSCIGSGSEAVQNAAIYAVEQLITGGSPDDTEPPSNRAGGLVPDARNVETTPHGHFRRTSQDSSRRGGEAQAVRDALRETADALNSLRLSKTASPYLRHRAAAVLVHMHS